MGCISWLPYHDLLNYSKLEQSVLSYVYFLQIVAAFILPFTSTIICLKVLQHAHSALLANMLAMYNI